MSLQFILGNSGSGKSQTLYQKIIDASIQSPETKFLVIVPEQFTMQTQRELVHLHPAGGIWNIDILSFARLSHRVFEETAAEQRRVLEESGKTLLLRRAATREGEQLKVLKGSLKKRGCLKQMKSILSELVQYDIGEGEMEQLMEASRTNPRLACKLEDIQTLYDAFQRELEGKYITAEQTLELLCEKAADSSLLKDAVIALDGFTGFTPIQNKLLRKLMTITKEIYVTVTVDSERSAGYSREQDLFYLSSRTIRSLRMMAEEEGCPVLPSLICREPETARKTDPSMLRHLKRQLFRSGHRMSFAVSERAAEEISLHIATDPRGEAEAAAQTIRSLVQKGYRYRDIAVIVGDPASYVEHLPRIFRDYDIPCFMDQKRNVLSNPMVELIRALMEMLRRDYSRETVFRCLRTGLCRQEAEHTDLLENFCMAAGIRGFSKWKKSFAEIQGNFTEEQRELCEAQRAAWMEPLLTLTPLLKSKKTTVREKTEGLYRFLAHYDVQRQLSSYEQRFHEEGEEAYAKEYAQVYAEVIRLFDKMVELLGAETLSLEEYAELLEAGFEEMRIGIIPPTSDCVQVGDLERTRLNHVKVMLVLGLNDGWVPKSGGNGGLLSDFERELLGSSGVELAPTAKQESYIQKFYLYLAFTKPTDHLYLSCCRTTGDGSVMRPSYVMRTIQRLFPTLTIHDESGKSCLNGRASTPKSALKDLTAGLRTLGGQVENDPWLELYQWYRGQENYQALTDNLISAAFLTFDRSGIGAKAAKELYGSILTGSISRLEQFATCACKHFLQYGLRITERQEYRFLPVDMGNLFHAAMQAFAERVRDSEYSWKDLPEEKRELFLDESLQAAAEKCGGAILHATARNEALLARIRRILKRTVWALQLQVRAGSFVPTAFEIPFSQYRELESVTIPLEDGQMQLKGRIDRIDLSEQEDQIYLKIVDYKSGKTKFDLNELYYGLQLQLVVYLSAAMELEARLHPEKEIVPAGIFYSYMRDPLLETDESQVEEAMLKALCPNGLVNDDPEILKNLDNTLAPGEKSAVIPVDLTTKGVPSKRSKTVTTEQFRELGAFARRKMQENGSRILAGETAPNPFERTTGKSCDFCIYQSVCRMDRKIPGMMMRKLKEYSQEELWELLRTEKDTEESK
ncbi:MAG: PD-(D/E)XK nuclease family protein [Eubacteriales bacterium]|nr:PD-(D/E)XK nuclease family protein [Eubacteriales bacterium]